MSAMTDRKVVVNNASIWRPILDLRDATSAYLRAIQADYSLSGVYNVASGNYTVGQVGDMVKNKVERLTGRKIGIEIRNIQDFRNYKVNFEKASTHLGFQPRYSVDDIVDELYAHQDQFGQYSDDRYYNIRVFSKMLQSPSADYIQTGTKVLSLADAGS
jgi:nucleoside-diphosphate-sugar epimerase